MTDGAPAETSAAAAARRLRERELADARAVLATEQGRRFLWWLLGEAGTHSISYVRGDAYETAFREGQRNTGIMLEARINAADPLALLTMQREALEDAARRRRTAAGEAADEAAKAEG